MRIFLFAALIGIFLTATIAAHAQLVGTDTTPGDSCTDVPPGTTRMTADADQDGGQVTLICDGSVWRAPSVAAAGNDREIQFNSGGALSGSTDLVYDSAGRLGVGTGIPAASLDVAGEIKFSSSGLACGAAQEGTVRYVSSGASPPWEFCDGSAWVNFKQPRCQDDDTGECYLDATRSNDDPDFVASNIVDGVNILGVIGNFAECGVYHYSFEDKLNVAKSTVIESEIAQVSTNSCSADVSISGDGSPEYRICSNSDCTTVDHTWASSGNSIDNGQYLQIRLTSPASGSTSHVATVTAGGALESWSVKTIADAYTVFATSTTYDGLVDGIGGADKKCRDLASAQGLGSNYMAWLAEKDTNTEPWDRFFQSSSPYHLVDDTKVADNWADLTDGTLDNAISLDEAGVSVSNTVWTNVDSGGAAVDTTESGTCFSWATDDFNQSGYRGNTGKTGSGWTNDGTSNCSNSNVLYCFEQPDDPVGTHKKVFVTSSTYNGNLGSIAGADTKCQTAADNAGLLGTYKAWITSSDSSQSPSNRFAQASVPYRLVDGTRIADNWADLTDNALQTGIVIAEDGTSASGGRAWSNTMADGTSKGSNNCSDWGTNDFDLDGHSGKVGLAGSEWSDKSATSGNCSWSLHLYCVEQ